MFFNSLFLAGISLMPPGLFSVGDVLDEVELVVVGRGAGRTGRDFFSGGVP